MSGTTSYFDVTAKRVTGDPNEVTLLVGDTLYGGWQSVRITRGVERMPSDFDIALTETYPGQTTQAALQPGQPVVVRIGTQTVITGYLDTYTATIAPGAHNVRISGRGKCADLVDCAAGFDQGGATPGQIGNAYVLDIATQLSAPFGINARDLVADPGLIVPLFNIIFGETVYEIVDRCARYTARLAYEDQFGDLVLAQAGTDRHASGFEQGKNIQAASGSYSLTQRFSHYFASLVGVDIYKQTGDAVFMLPLVRDAKAFPASRFRPMCIVSGELQYADGAPIAELRAQWEMARRLGRSQAVRVTCDSWRDGGKGVGQLWTPNMLAPVKIPALKLDDVWVISEVTYLRGEDGTTAELTLMPKEAFTPEPAVIQQFDWQVAQGLKQGATPTTPASH